MKRLTATRASEAMRAGKRVRRQRVRKALHPVRAVMIRSDDEGEL